MLDVGFRLSMGHRRQDLGRLHGCDRAAPPKADFGYVLGEPSWGRGFATEAAKAVADWTVGQPSIFRLWATCHPDNLASARVLTKAGLVREATLMNWEARPQLGEAAGPSLMFARLKQR